MRALAWFSAAFDACVYVQTPPLECQPGVVLTLSNRGFVGGRGVCGGSDGGVCFKVAWNPVRPWSVLRPFECFENAVSCKREQPDGWKQKQERVETRIVQEGELKGNWAELAVHDYERDHNPELDR